MDYLYSKIGSGLGLSLQLPEDLRKTNLSMSTGYDPLNHKWEVIVKYNGNLETMAQELDAQIEILTERFAIITLRADKIMPLSLYKEIEYIEKPKPVTPTLGFSLHKSCITPVQNDMPYRLTGKGVAVGIVDSGIDYAHPDFINENGTSRILYIWDQTIEGNPPDGFNMGAEYTNEMINQALAIQDISERMGFLPHYDAHSHGTHVAGIAAGNGRQSRGVIKGAAPEATLIIVKLGQVSRTSITKTTEIMRAIKYVIERAEQHNMPVAINLSYGTSEGSHDGTSLFDTFIDDISLKWKNVICAATGNEAASGCHKSGLLRNGLTEDIEFVVDNGFNSLTIEIWKPYFEKCDIEIISPGGKSTGRVSFRAINQHFQLGQTVVYMEFADATPFSESECIMAVLFPYDSRELAGGIWTIRLHPVSIISGKYDIWMLISGTYETSSYFLTPSPYNTVTSPSTVKNVISVGGYDGDTDKISYFSGRGTIPYNDTPDLAAPAENITSTIPGGGYDSLTGTSMACPHVTGSAALLMQWGIVKGNDPYLYGQKVKACLKSGARKSENITYPSSEWGYGMLCLLDSFAYLKG